MEPQMVRFALEYEPAPVNICGVDQGGRRKFSECYNLLSKGALAMRSNNEDIEWRAVAWQYCIPREAIKVYYEYMSQSLIGSCNTGRPNFTTLSRSLSVHLKANHVLKSLNKR